MVHKCLTGMKIAGKVCGAMQFERTDWISNGITGIGEWSTDSRTEALNNRLVIKFGRKLSCNSYEVEIPNVFGGPNNLGVALVKGNGSFVVKMCGTWIQLWNALSFSYISENNNDGFFTIRGKFNKCYTAASIEVSSEYDSKMTNTFINNNFASSYCSNFIQSGLLKKC